MSTQVTWVTGYEPRWTYFDGSPDDVAGMAIEAARHAGFHGPAESWVFNKSNVNLTRDQPILVKR